MRSLRILALLLGSFAAGGGAAELGLRAKSVRDVADRMPAPGSAGDFVALQVLRDGVVVANPRLVTSPGKAAHLVLRDPVHGGVRLSLRVEATREATGLYTLDYAVTLPGDDVVSIGRLDDVAPGVEHAVDLGDEALTAVVVAVPVPSAAFDAWLEAERDGRVPGRPPA